MRNEKVDLSLLEKAQRGHQESLSALAEQVREDMYAYLLRMTLDAHLAEDLCQETIVQMLQSLPKLEFTNVKGFWAWMYKTALSKVYRQSRGQKQARQHQQILTETGGLRSFRLQTHDGAKTLMRKELSGAIYEAMSALKLTHRNILTLRCLQNLSYAEIAHSTGGTELQARLMFFRAKQSLRHQLASRGYKRKEHLLPALSMFAVLTAGKSKVASAATMVKASSLQVSAGTAALGWLRVRSRSRPW